MTDVEGTSKRLLYKKEIYEIVGAAIEVHKVLGPGFLEAIYQEAIEIELTERNIPFHPQQMLNVQYKDRILKQHYVADLICYDKIIVELKALNELSKRETAQILNYLKATGLRVGLLINFGARGRLEWKRYVV